MVHHTLICHSYITIKRCLSYNVFPILFFLAHTNAISTLKAKFKSAFILQVHLVASSLNFNVGPNAFKSKIAHVLAILDRCCFCVFAVFCPLDGIFLSSPLRGLQISSHWRRLRPDSMPSVPRLLDAGNGKSVV